MNGKQSLDPNLGYHRILAQECVDISNNSRNFTLVIYPGQQEFYNKYMKIWYDYKLAFSENADDHQIAYIQHIDSELHRLIGLGMLSFTHLLVAFIIVISTVFAHDKVHQGTNRKLNAIKDLDKYVKSKYDLIRGTNIIPFVSLGIDMDSWLFLYYNGMYAFVIYPTLQEYPMDTQFNYMRPISMYVDNKLAIQKYKEFALIDEYNKRLYDTLDTHPLEEKRILLSCMYRLHTYVP